MATVDLKARIQARLDATGKAPTPVASEIGRGRDFILDILNGRKATLPSDTITPLAVALECDERYFTDPAFTEPGRPRRTVSDERMADYERGARLGYHTFAWRDYRHLSLQDVSAESRLTPGTVSDIEQGLLDPSPDQLAALARAFGTNPGLLQSNPFMTSERLLRLVSISEGLDPGDQAALIDMAEALQRRKSA